MILSTRVRHDGSTSVRTSHEVCHGSPGKDNISSPGTRYLTGTPERKVTMSSFFETLDPCESHSLASLAACARRDEPREPFTLKTEGPSEPHDSGYEPYGYDCDTGDYFSDDAVYEPQGGWEALYACEPPAPDDDRYGSPNASEALCELSGSAAQEDIGESYDHTPVGNDAVYADTADRDISLAEACVTPDTLTDTSADTLTDTFTDTYSDTYADTYADTSAAPTTEYYEGPDLSEPREPLEVLSSAELPALRFKPVRYIVDGLLPPGLAVLAGSPKIGKSWLVLQLCMKIAKGEAMWGNKTRQGAALYIALEDSHARLQKRVNLICDELSPELYFATSCSYLGDELERELVYFVRQHPNTRVIVIDTFQKIRSATAQMSYANDYAEVSRLKQMADELNLCILLLHHTRKMGDNDRINEISGTNGIAGSADTLMVLTKSKRSVKEAELTVTGRDVGDLELKLSMDPQSFIWKCESGMPSASTFDVMPRELEVLVSYIKSLQIYEGSNSALAEAVSQCIGREITAKTLKRQMSRYRMQLEDHGISYMSRRTSTARSVLVVYSRELDKYGDG